MFPHRHNTYEILEKRIKEMSDKTIRIYEQHPEKLHTEKDILHYFDKAQKDIEQLERVILQLKAYENALTERYNFIKTAPTKQKIRSSSNPAR